MSQSFERLIDLSTPELRALLDDDRKLRPHVRDHHSLLDCRRSIEAEIDRRSKGLSQGDEPSTWRAYKPLIIIALIVLAGVIVLVVTASHYDAIRYSDPQEKVINPKAFNESIIFSASWVLLLLISLLASNQIKEIMQASSGNQFRRRANILAIIIGLVLAVFLFKQPYLEELFPEQTRRVIKTLLFAGGAGTGWMAWYLRHLHTYGEFFHVFLLTIIIGFCWYARLTAPEAVQLTAVAFLLGSLFHIAKDYLDQAAAKPSSEE